MKKILLVSFLLLIFLGNAFAKGRVVLIEMDARYFASINGYPPVNRNAYLPLIEKVNGYSPRVIFWDMAFIRKPVKGEENFIKNITAKRNIVLPILISDEGMRINYDENKPFFGTKIKNYQLKPKKYFRQFPGLEFPFYDASKNSSAICVSFFPYEKIVTEMEFYGYFNGYLYENSNIVIANEYLKKYNYRLIFNENFLQLSLLDLKLNKILKTIAKFNSTGLPLNLPIEYSDMITLSANTFMNAKENILEDKIIIIGTNASGLSDKSETPFGIKSSISIKAHEVNTLLNQIKEYLPKE